MLSAAPNQSDIAQYYDQHTRLALRDWVHGNQRITKAWCTNQYIHVVIGRNPCYQLVKQAEPKSGLLARVLPSLIALRARRESQRRKELVRLRLGQDV